MVKISNTKYITKNGIVKNIPKSNRIKLIKKESQKHYSLKSKYTVYAEFHKAIFFDKDITELKNKRKLLIKTLRENGVKVSQKRNTDLINSLEIPFKRDIAEYKIIQKEAIKRFDEIYKKGLYAPTMDNKKLDEAIKLTWKLNEFNFRNRAISIINAIYQNTVDIEQNIQRYKTYIKVSV